MVAQRPRAAAPNQSCYVAFAVGDIAGGLMTVRRAEVMFSRVERGAWLVCELQGGVVSELPTQR